jgi:proteasome lid subunit RPN8/RPN11
VADGPPVTLDPEQLDQFVHELLAAGFRASGTNGRAFIGPVPSTLGEFSDATEMTIVIADAWPYRQPHVIVPGIDWWHAAHEMPCLWQVGDNTKRWMTLDGLLDRIDEWVAHAKAGFTTIDGAALDPQLYFDRYTHVPAAIDVDGLVGGLAQDGQHGLIHLDFITDELAVIQAGKGSNRLWGRWLYRTDIAAPPRDLASFERALTDNQLTRLNKVIAAQGKGLFALAWPTVHGTACLLLIIDQTGGTRKAFAISPAPISQMDRLRRAGPDSAILRPKRTVLFGAGAIGSHVGSLLSRSGVGHLVVIDGDMKLPAGVVRHAGTAVGVGKAAEMRDLLSPFDWTTVEVVLESSWDLDRVAELITGVDLCVDATGLTPFAELLSRIASTQEVPMITVALYRGGRIARIRRQGPDDHPIVYRTSHWRYPAIPASNDRSADFVGAETGCAAPIHNAPPSAVTSAASLAALLTIDFLSGRMSYPDETIDVLEPIEEPFDKLGRHTPQTPTVMITESARRTMVAAAANLHPNETGGILIGVLDEAGAPCIIEAVEFRPSQPSTLCYEVPQGRTTAAVDAARTRDKRVGYLGEWHSHPTDQPASPTDRATMTGLATHPHTGNPVLLVLRPTSSGQFTIDAHMSHNGELLPAPLIEVGPVASEEPA